MKMCMPHWDNIRKELAERGLDKFIAKGGEQAAKRLVSNEFEPLLGAHNAIMMNALKTIGPGLLVPNEDGSEKCPICYLKASVTCGHEACLTQFDDWPKKAADDQLKIAQERGLLQVQ